MTIRQIGYRGSEEIGDLRKTGQPAYKAGPGRVAMGNWEEGIFEREDDWSSVAYFYLDRPSSDLPVLDPLDARTASLQ